MVQSARELPASWEVSGFTNPDKEIHGAHTGFVVWFSLGALIIIFIYLFEFALKEEAALL